MGAVTKVRVCLPKDRVLISPTTIRRSSKEVPKKEPIMENALAEDTIVVSGKTFIKLAILAEWSGSMC